MGTGNSGFRGNVLPLPFGLSGIPHLGGHSSVVCTPLFAVGVGFAAAYKLSGNNLIVSFFVNLPNAFVTYILKYEQFPVMRVSSTIAAAVTLVLIGLILLSYYNCVRYSVGK